MAGYTITLPKSSLTSSGSYIEGQLRLEQTIDKAALSSSVTAKLYVRKGNDATTLTEPTEGTWSYKLQIGSTAADTTNAKLSVLTSWVHIDTLSVNLNHASDGTLSVRIIASITAPSGTTLAGKTTNYDKTLSIGSIALPTTIDSLTCSTNYVDGVITAKYTPKGASFYNQCKTYVMVSGKENEIYSQNLGQKTTGQKTHTIQFTAEQLSKIYGLVKTTINATIRVKFLTYSNSAYTILTGTTREYLEIVLTLPTSVAPKASLTIVKNNPNSWIKGKDIYVAGLSGLSATLSATPSAGIDEKDLTYTITYDGATYNAKTLNVTTLRNSGTIVAKVTDPRGRYATVTEPINVLSYSAPAIASIQVERGTYKDGWTPSEEGPDVKVVFKTTLSLTSYDNTYSAAFKIDGSSKTPNYGATAGLKTGTDCTVYFLGINGEVSHTLALTATDLAGGAGTANFTIPTIRITIEFNESGNGIAFGKTSEKDAFECGWDAEFSGSVKLIRDDGSEVLLDDTGWIDLGLSTNVSKRDNDLGHAGSGCKYRVINGNHVYVAFACDVPYSNASIVVNANAIPQSYRPKQHIYGLSASGGRTITALYVHYNGQIYINYIQQITATSNTTSLTTWVDGYIDYFI